MSKKSRISKALQHVKELHHHAQASPQLKTALATVKRFQTNRLTNTYKDLALDPTFSSAVAFFIEELYGVKDFQIRDAQFSKVAPSIESLFPSSIGSIACEIAELHELSEALDLEMARQLLAAFNTTGNLNQNQYTILWNCVGRSKDRYAQLETILDVGERLRHLCKKPLLKALLTSMRQPATLVGLRELHQFLETGFNVFSIMAKKQYCLDHFLTTIRARERDWFDSMNIPCTDAESGTTLGI